MNLVFSLLLLTTEPRTGGGATGGDDHVVVGGWPRLNSEKTPLGGPSLRVCFLQGWGLSLIPFLISIWPLPGAALAPGVETFIAGSCRPYGRGISSCLQMARTVPSLISRWRGPLAIFCNEGLNQILWAAPAIQNATVLAQMAFQFREFHASAISITSRTACGERPFSASSRWHCSASFSASARFALASSMVSPCEIAAGISSTKQV